MRTVYTVVAMMGLAMVTPALAQSTTPTTGSPNATASSNATVQPGAMQASVKHDLEQAGFTNVQVMPSSFLVRAKDKAGRPVMMVINPDSVTEITNLPASGATAKH